MTASSKQTGSIINRNISKNFRATFTSTGSTNLGLISLRVVSICFLLLCTISICTGAAERTSFFSNRAFTFLGRHAKNINVNLNAAGLKARGGSVNANISMETSSVCLNYAKIGLINLSRGYQDDEEDDDGILYVHKDDDEGSNVAMSIVEKWIQDQSTKAIRKNNNVATSTTSERKIGSMIVIPTTSTDMDRDTINPLDDGNISSFFTEASFVSTGDSDDESVGNTVETMGCLADAIILFYDTSNTFRQKAIVRLIKGIERQRASRAGKLIEVLVLVNANDDGALMELDAIRQVLGDGDEELAEMIHIVPTFVKGEEDDREDEIENLYGEMLDVVDDALDRVEHHSSLESAVVPMHIFPRLVQSVFGKLTGDSDGSTLSFDARRVERMLPLDVIEEEKESEKGLHEIEDNDASQTEDIAGYDNEGINPVVTNVKYGLEYDESEYDESEYGSDREEEHNRSYTDDFEESLTEEIEDYDSEGINPTISLSSYEKEAVTEISSVAAAEEESNAFIYEEGRQDDEAGQQIFLESEQAGCAPVEEFVENNIEGEPTSLLREEQRSEVVTNAENVGDSSPAYSEEQESSSHENILSPELEMEVEQRIKECTHEIDQKLSALELKQDEVLLDDKKMPILEFGDDGGRILLLAQNIFNTSEIRKRIESDIDKDFVGAKLNEIVTYANQNVRRLFENQLQSLREYYGRRYEAVIEDLEEKDGDMTRGMDTNELKQRRIKHDAILAEEAKRSTEGFRAAADHAIPLILKNGDLKELRVGYSYESSLDGLIRDMMQATSAFQSLEDEWEDVNAAVSDDAEDVVEGRRRGPVKWYEKLAARVMVFGVNYLQGWLAYQGIKKAAEDRDRMMPKFPLF